MSNLTAFLSVVAACEGTKDAYNIIVGGGRFDSYADHPRVAVQTKYGWTSAAGRYQIMCAVPGKVKTDTWGDFIKAEGPHDFSPASQDACAVWLIQRRGALDDVNAGRLEDAITKCNKEWASLPGSPYGQTTRDLQFCLDAYTQAGGVLADRTDAPAPIEDKSTEAPKEAPVADDSTSDFLSGALKVGEVALTAINPVLGGLASALINAFEPMARTTIAAAINKHTDNPQIGTQVADAVINAAKQVTGLADPTVAAATALTNDSQRAQVQAMVLSNVQAMAPVLDNLAKYDQQTWDAEQAGRDAAAARAKSEPWDMTRTVVLFAGATSTFMVISILCAILWQIIGQDKEPNTALMSLAGPLFMAALVCWKDVFAYRFDGTKESAAKDAAIAQLAK